MPVYLDIKKRKILIVLSFIPVLKTMIMDGP